MATPDTESIASVRGDDEPQPEFKITHPRKRAGKLPIFVGRAIVLAALLCAWQFLPTINALSDRFRFLDSFFISSPTKVAQRVWDLATGTNGQVSIWPYLGDTIIAAIEGFAIACALGLIVGVVMSNAPRLYDLVGVFLVAFNSVPRIALIPIIVVIFGTGREAAVISCVLAVFFLMFFNCVAGGLSVPPPVLDNARVMGASSTMVMMRIRLRYVLLWAFAAVPNAVAFSLLAVIAFQLLSGSGGVGLLLVTATSNVDATGTFAIVVYLSVAGVLLLRAAELAKRRLLHWADSEATPN